MFIIRHSHIFARMESSDHESEDGRTSDHESEDESSDAAHSDDDFPEPVGAAHDDERALVPQGSARWEWLDDAAVQRIVQLASVVVVFVVASLDRRSRREAEPRANRIFPLTKAPFGLTRAELSGCKTSVSLFGNEGTCSSVANGTAFALLAAKAVPRMDGSALTSCLTTDEHISTLAAAMARARALVSVTSFALSNCRVPGGLGPLSQAWADGSMPRLHTLQLDSCSLKDEGVAELSDALISGTPSLTALNLSWNELTYSSIPTLRKIGLALKLSSHAGRGCTCTKCVEIRSRGDWPFEMAIGLDLSGNLPLSHAAVTMLRHDLPTVGIRSEWLSLA